MNTEIQRGLVQSATPLTPNGPLQSEVDDHFWGHACAIALFERSAVVQSTNLKQKGGPVLQATSSARSPKTMNAEIQPGSGHEEGKA